MSRRMTEQITVIGDNGDFELTIPKSVSDSLVERGIIYQCLDCGTGASAGTFYHTTTENQSYADFNALANVDVQTLILWPM